MAKRILALCISFLLLAATLAACGTAPAQSPAGSEPPAAAAPADPADSTSTVDDSGKYDPGIEFTTVRRVDSHLTLPDGQTYEDNVWTQAFAEELGINIKVEWTADSSQFENKLNLAIASGELPDFMRVNQEQLAQLIATDSLADLTEVFEQYASEDTKRQYGVGDSIALRASSSGGSLYAIPSTASAIAGAGTPLVWIRTDWLENLNLPEPETMEDLLNIARAFTFDDPDGNGRKDTVGIAFINDQIKDLGIFNGFHAYPSAWVKDEDGSLSYGSIQPETRNALEQMQQLYAEGVIDPEFAVKDWGKWNEMLVAGEVGITFGAHWFGQLVHNLKVRDENAEWKPFMIPSVDDEPSKITLKSPVLEYFVVRKGYEHPEALVLMYNYYYSITVGERASLENYHKFMYDKDDGSIQYVALCPIVTNDATDIAFKQMVEAFDANDASLAVEMDAQTIWNNAQKALEGEHSLYGWTLYYPAWKLFFEIMDEGLYVNDEFFGAPTVTMSDRKATLDKLEEEIFTQIVMGALPIEGFDEFVDNWKSLGGEQITAEVNEWYQAIS